MNINKPQKLFYGLLALMMVFGLTFRPATQSASAQVSEACGEPSVFTLWAGKTIDAGTITVSNDAENLYVVYQISGEWKLAETHLYIASEPFVERLPPGQAPYKWESGEDPVTSTSFTFTVPLEDVDCGSVLYLQAHAALIMYDENGEPIQEETGYGGDITEPDQGAWFGNITYVVVCCDNPPETCFAEETAWAAGTRYVSKGNWATYTSYSGVAQEVILFAGQTMTAGTVAFSAPDNGQVTITITLAEGWFFQEVAENLKIQDYAVAPSGNPSPGLFAWKATAPGSPFSIGVPQNNFYGVHVDVMREVACLTPVGAFLPIPAPFGLALPVVVK